MTRSKEDILDAIALLKAMTVVVNMQGNQNLFGDALNTIAAAIAEIHEEKDPEQSLGLDNLQRRFQ
jgi:hypothetical protein